MGEDGGKRTITVGQTQLSTRLFRRRGLHLENVQNSFTVSRIPVPWRTVSSVPYDIKFSHRIPAVTVLTKIIIALACGRQKYKNVVSGIEVKARICLVKHVLSSMPSVLIFEVVILPLSVKAEEEFRFGTVKRLGMHHNDQRCGSVKKNLKNRNETVWIQLWRADN